jgi:hypothetical protein
MCNMFGFKKKIITYDGGLLPVNMKKKKKVKNTKGLWDTLRALRAEGFRPTKIEVSRNDGIEWSLEYVEKAPSKTVREKKKDKG